VSSLDSHGRFKPRMSRVAAVVIATSVLAAAVVGGWALGVGRPGSAVAADPNPMLGRVSVPSGQALTLSASDQKQIQELNAESGQHVTSVAFLLTRNGRSFYRAQNEPGNACYAVGPATPATSTLGIWSLGQIDCKPDFPSATDPVLDFTVLHGSGTVWRSEGVAADGVVDVALQMSDGSLASVTPVVDNVYSLPDIPSASVDALVARDAAGNVVWSEPLK
jgi:hypothetical protein